jgi:hypothetical protein
MWLHKRLFLRTWSRDLINEEIVSKSLAEKFEGHVEFSKMKLKGKTTAPDDLFVSNIEVFFDDDFTESEIVRYLLDGHGLHGVEILSVRLRLYSNGPIIQRVEIV